MAESYIIETQKAFDGLITKPKLQDKYLKRPPFRFIHDIISNTYKSTGFPNELYNEYELNSKNIKVCVLIYDIFFIVYIYNNYKPK